MEDINQICLDEEFAVEYYLMGFDKFPKGGFAVFDCWSTDVKYKNAFVRGVLERNLQIFAAEGNSDKESLLFVGNLPKKDWANLVAKVMKGTNLPAFVKVVKTSK